MTAFHSFARLPPELRDLIWRHALPDNVGPALYFYKKGCWHPRYLTESDPDYDPREFLDGDPLNINFEFRYDLLCDAQLSTPPPTWFVNCEARAATLKWAAEQGIEVKRPRGGPPAFVRRYDPETDALYVEPSRWVEFLTEPWNRILEPDLENAYLGFVPNLTRLAVPASILQPAEGESSGLLDLDDNYCNLEELLIVIDPQPEPLLFIDTHTNEQDRAPESKWQWRWEFEGAPGEVLVWDRNITDFVVVPGSDDHGRGEGYFSMRQDVRGDLRSTVVDFRRQQQEFRARPVFAFRL